MIAHPGSESASTGRGQLEDYLTENELRRGEDYVHLYKALRESEPVLAQRIADAGAAVFPQHEKLRRLRRGAQPKKHKVFGIGLSKTGTTSLTFALERLGYSAAHWRKMPEKEILTWKHMDQFDALTDISISFILEALYYAYPGALFVYTVRNPAQWEESIENHFHWLGGFDGLKKRIASGKPHSRPVEAQPIWQPIHEALYARHSSWREAFDAHDTRIESFFNSSERRRQLLKIDLTTGTSRDRWAALCPFLGEDIPLCPIPHRNSKLQMKVTAAPYTEEVELLISEGSRTPDNAVGL